MDHFNDRGKNKEPKKLTPQECANLQGFPKNFIISESSNQAYKQFGNSLPIPVVKSIIKEMLNNIIISRNQRKFISFFLILDSLYCPNILLFLHTPYRRFILYSNFI